MRTITSQTPTNKHLDKHYPANPYQFAKELEELQSEDLEYGGTFLFNKGRYFEGSLVADKETIARIEEKAGLTPLDCTYMSVGSWDKLEAFINATNAEGLHISITVDWV